ncbi:MAG TPA: transporter [Candidatus Polarisedimenticolaceae bacterium]|nr:transporter [Candidatus Polarisedimenticolaceae bacterium]
MRNLARALLIPLSILLLTVTVDTHAQTQPSGSNAAPPPSATSTDWHDRLFHAFIEDPAIADRQWWEGQIVYIDGPFDDFSATLIRGVFAIRMMPDVEVGARVGFGEADLPGGNESGATDLDIWGKYSLGSTTGGFDVAVGGVATVPTGDDSAGLGFDAFALSAFGAARWQFESFTIGARAGLRFNEDGRDPGGNDIDGKTSWMAGGSVTYPFSDRASFVGEVNYESERFDGGETDASALGGINWRLGERGVLRGAIQLGLSDGAPDTLLLVGYAHRF